MSEKPNAVINFLSACLVVPMAALSIAKELHRTLVQIKKNEYPTCRNCRHWDKQELCLRDTRVMPAVRELWLPHEYCSKWEEA